MLNLRQLQCARALAEHRHFGRAAQTVGITQSGLTQNIHALEAHYQVTLFNRSRRGGVAPTVFGEALIRGADQVLNRLQEIEREIRLLNNLETGQLVVGADPMLANALLAPALTVLLQRHPGLRFTVVSGGAAELLAELAEQRIDLFIGFPDRDHRETLARHRLDLPAPAVVCRADHPLLKREDRVASDYLDYPLVQGPVARWYLDWAAEQLDTDFPVDALLRPYFLHATDITLLTRITRDTEAIFATMRDDVAEALMDGALVEIPPPLWPERVPAEIVWSADRPLVPAAQRLTEELLRCCERIGGRQQLNE